MDSIKDKMTRQDILQDLINDAQRLSQTCAAMQMNLADEPRMEEYTTYTHMAYIIEVMRSRIKVLAGWHY